MGLLNACKSYFSVEQRIFGCVLFKTEPFWMGCRKLSNQGLLWICLTPLYDWCKELTPLSLIQSDANLKPITTWKPVFSCALGNLRGFTLSSLIFWLIVVITLVFGLRHSIEKRSMSQLSSTAINLYRSDGNNLKLIIFSEKIFAHSKTGYLTYSPITNKKKSICYFRVA